MNMSWWALRAAELGSLILLFSLIRDGWQTWLLCIVGCTGLNLAGWIEGRLAPWKRNTAFHSQVRVEGEKP
jgi:hypothetical protein